MSLRFSRIALAALLMIVAHQSASAQFTVLSQNTLHLGWGKVPLPEPPRMLTCSIPSSESTLRISTW